MNRLLCILSGMNVGGAETFLMKVYRNIDRTKYQMDFCINVKEKCYYEDEILGLGGKIFRIPSKSENVKRFKSQLAKIIKENRYDHVLRITSNAMGLMDLQIAKKAGASICCARSSNASDGSSLKSRFFHQLGRILYNGCVDVKIAPSDLAARHTFGNKAYENGRVNILHNGVDLDVFKYFPEERKNIRKNLCVSTETRLIGHIGRFDEQKNHDFLLEIFNRIHAMDSNTKLLLIGKGPLEERMRQKASNLGLLDRIIFAGTRSDVPSLLSAMDVFVMPSLYEGMPNAVIEAQATGLPCLIADTVTKEADITGLVQYLSLEESHETWAKVALSMIDSFRKDTHDCFLEKGYDIQSVSEEFVLLCGMKNDF